jgi:hypothetical protein
LKPITKLGYPGTVGILKKFVSPFAIEYLPLISAILTAVGLAFQADLNAGLYNLIIKFVLMLVKSTGAFAAADLFRLEYFIDCTDYVKQLPQANLEELPYSSSPSSSKNLISYTREEPTRHEAFVSTSPNKELHYQQELKNRNVRWSNSVC